MQIKSLRFDLHMVALDDRQSVSHQELDYMFLCPQGDTVYRDNPKLRGSSTCYSPAAECNRGGAYAPPAGDGFYVDTSWIKSTARSIREMTR
jgi:hypothetical protein